MTAYAGLGALPHFYLYRGARVKVSFMDTKASGCDLNDGIFAVTVKILMQPALTGVVKYTQFLSGTRQRFVSVIADGAVAHGREHHRHRQFKLRLKTAIEFSGFVTRYPVRLFAEENLGFHRFAERVDRRVRDLRGIYKYPVPVYRQRLRIAHRRKKDTAAVCLLVYLIYRIVLPIRVFTQRTVAPDYFQRPCGAKRHTALTVYTFCLIAYHYAAFRVIAVHLVRTLSFANSAAYTARVVAHNFKFRINKSNSHQKEPSSA